MDRYHIVLITDHTTGPTPVAKVEMRVHGTGEWVRFADVPALPPEPGACGQWVPASQLDTAQRELDAARASLRGKLEELSEVHRQLDAARDAERSRDTWRRQALEALRRCEESRQSWEDSCVGARKGLGATEAELRTARAELADAQANIGRLVQSVERLRGIKRRVREVLDSCEASDADAALAPDARWYYDMAAAPPRK